MNATRRFPVLALFVLVGFTGAPHRGTPAPTLAPPDTIAIRVSEGTELGFDLSPDGRSIVFDLLGELWLVPAQGGSARPITDAVRDTAEDLDPSFSPDGRRVAFTGERAGRTGLWLLDIDSGRPRQLTQLADPSGYDGNAAWSPDGRRLAFTRVSPPDTAGADWRVNVALLDVVSGGGAAQVLRVQGLPQPEAHDPTWVGGGRIAFVAGGAPGRVGGRIWIVAATGGTAMPVTAESIQALAPAFAPDGRHVAYFAPDSIGRMQVWMQPVPDSGAAPSAPVRLTDHADVTATRIRWTPDGAALVYSADGRLWRVAASGGRPSEIPFTASLTIVRARRTLPPARFPEPGVRHVAPGFTGLAISPDGRRIGVLALGKLWVIPIGGVPRAVADAPLHASGLAWSLDGAQVAWSAGVVDQEDIYATDLTTGATHRVTALPGRESHPAYSPDGRYLAFVHWQEDPQLRVVNARAVAVADTAHTMGLGSLGMDWTSPPQWSPESDRLLIAGAADPNQPRHATVIALTGQRRPVTHAPDAPLSLQWTPQHTIVFVRHDRIWQTPFDDAGMVGDPQAVGSAPALYLSAARDGTLLFVSEGGLRLRTPGGAERQLGWPLSYTPPLAAPLLLRNVRIIDGTGAPPTPPRDVLLRRGRIARIAPTGTLPIQGVRVLDAGGRVAIPGLMDLHAHNYRPDFLPGFLYFGVTSVRDQGSNMAPLVAYADAIAAGVLQGPRVGYGGFQFYSDWSLDDEQGRGLEPEADPDHVMRSEALSQAFGAQHVKTRTFRRWDINARMITEAHRRGLRVTGHCAHPLPLVAAGMDAKEHIGLCALRGNRYMYDDLIQLFRAAGIGVVPTISYLSFAVHLNERPTLLEGDRELAPFVPGPDNFRWMLNLSAARRAQWAQDAQRAREMAAKLWRAGLTVGTGTDIWQIPIGVHMELEELVAAGLPPLAAIHVGTGAAARILGADADLGTIESGKWADLVILDADPLADIRNTRRIWQVVKLGRLVDRPAILEIFKGR